MSDKQYSRTGTQVLYASAIGSVISTIVSNPIEVAKLNLQFFPLICPQYPHPNLHELRSCGCSRFSFEGSLKSLKIALPQTVFNNLVSMQIYEQARQFFIKHTSLNSHSSTLASCISTRIIVSTLHFPVESLRIRLSNEVANHKVNLAGYRATLVRDIIFSAIFWPLLQHYRNISFQGEYRAKINEEQDFSMKNFTTNLVPGFLIASLASAVTSPLDTLKTRVQSQGLKDYLIIEGLKTIYDREGLKGLLYGVQWRVLKNSIHTSLYLFIYEWYMRSIVNND